MFRVDGIAEFLVGHLPSLFGEDEVDVVEDLVADVPVGDMPACRLHILCQVEALEFLVGVGRRIVAVAQADDHAAVLCLCDLDSRIRDVAQELLEVRAGVVGGGELRGGLADLLLELANREFASNQDCLDRVEDLGLVDGIGGL